MIDLQEVIGTQLDIWTVESVVVSKRGWPTGVLCTCTGCGRRKVIGKVSLMRRRVPDCVICNPPKKARPRKPGRKRKNYEKEHPLEYGTWKKIKSDACPRWKRSFREFLYDTGPKPEGSRVCKIKRGKPYSKGNFRYKLPDDPE